MANANPNDPNKQQAPGAAAEKPKPQPPGQEQEQKRAQAAGQAQKVQEVISANQQQMSDLSKKHSKESVAQASARGNRAPTKTSEGADMRSENDAEANRKLSSKHDNEVADAKAKLKPLPPILTL